MPLKEIKTKPEGGKPKLLDKAAKAPKTAMKDLWLKSKDKSISELKETPFASQRGESSNAPANTAGDQMLSGMETAAKKGANLTYRGGKKLAQATARKVKEKTRDFPHPVGGQRCRRQGCQKHIFKNTDEEHSGQDYQRKAAKGGKDSQPVCERRKAERQEDQDRTAFGKNSTAGGESGTENSAGHRKGG